MNPNSFWERHRGQPWGATPVPSGKAATPKPFQPLTPQESIAIVADAIHWLRDEDRACAVMPDGPFKERRRAELRARDKSLARDLDRLI